MGGAGEPPDPYVKLYLLPDPFKETKQKTKVIKGTFHPTFNEMVSFQAFCTSCNFMLTYKRYSFSYVISVQYYVK